MQSYGFTGRRYDSETKLYHYRNRVYSPTLGRFIQTDPKGYVDGYNLYAYVKNNPLRYLDPMGTRAVGSFRFDTIRDVDILSPSSNMYIDAFEGGITTPDGRYDYSSTNVSQIISSGITHEDLDFIGLLPGFGEPADAVNALWYLTEGDYTNAGFSTAAVLPFIGWEATGTKYGLEALDEVGDVVKWSEKQTDNIAIDANGNQLLLPAPGGTETIRQYENGYPEGHFSVEIYDKNYGTSFSTHQVINDYPNNKSTTIVNANMLRNDPFVHETTISIKNPTSAMNYQRSLINKELGAYDKYSNSCLSHVCDVLEVGGHRTISKTRLGYGKFLRREGFERLEVKK